MVKYKCVEDYQNTDWCIGEINTIEEWRQMAVGWADSDGYDDIVSILLTMPEKSVMDFISDFWSIGFEKIESDGAINE